MPAILQDFRRALRGLTKSPAFAAFAVLVLSLGIGAGTALYTILDGAFLHFSIFRASERWVVLRGRFLRQDYLSWFFSPAEYRELSRQTRAFEGFMALRSLSANLALETRPEHYDATAVTANTFALTGVPPLLGRTFLPEEDRPGGPNVVVISEELWRDRLGADPGILGRPIRVNGESYTVVGVMPRRYRLWGGFLWLPLRLDPSDTDRSRRWLWVSAYVRPGVSRAAVEAELEAIARRMEREHSAIAPEYAGWRLESIRVRDAVLRDLKSALVVLLGSVGLVLLISCADLAGLVLARLRAKARDIAVRQALGASRGRLLCEFLAEAALLSAAGGVLGLLLATWAVPELMRAIPDTYIPSEAEVRIGRTAIGVAFVLSCAVAAAFGLGPAIAASRQRAEALRAGDRIAGLSGRRARGLLVAVQVALAVVVTCGAALLLESYQRARRLDLGFAPDHVLTMRISLPQWRYPDGSRILAFHQELERRMRGIPAVESVAISSTRPLAETSTRDFRVEGEAPAAGVLPNADYRVVSPGYFALMRIPLRMGRPFDEADDARHPAVAVVNETMARKLWGASSPIGRRILPLHAETRQGMAPPVSDGPLTVVGVVGDTRQRQDPAAAVRPEFCVPLAQHAAEGRDAALLVRPRGEDGALLEATSLQVRSIDPEQPVYQVETLPEIVADALGPKRLSLLLLGLFAALALLLSAAGVYGVTARSVEERRREIGVRMALGAQRRQIAALFLGQGARPVTAGVAAGLAGTLLLTRVLTSLLFGVEPWDPAALGAVSCLIGGLGLAASSLPARRAARLDPAEALRSE